MGGCAVVRVSGEGVSGRVRGGESQWGGGEWEGE